MSIFERSRYAASKVVSIGNVSTILPDTLKQERTGFRWYTVKEHDRIDLIAAKAYQDPRLMHRIQRANPEILFWDSLKVGTRLRVPNAY